MCFSNRTPQIQQAAPAPPPPIAPMQFAGEPTTKDTAAKLRAQASRNSLLIDLPSTSGTGLNVPGQ